ncbi:MAG: flagellar basal body P-ring formation chaperone FlgA [Verrucomicrobiia bacterium]|jgi:flagella basal body P-ring formation protein FlgA
MFKAIKNITCIAGAVACLFVATLLAQPLCAQNIQQQQTTNVANEGKAFFINEQMVIDFLTKTLQQQYCDGKSELELRLSRPWTMLKTVSSNGVFKLIEGPGRQLSPTMMVKFEWRSDKESLGPFQVVVYAKLWKEVIIAARPLTRGTVLNKSDVDFSKRDIFQMREWLEDLPSNYNDVELVENIPQGQPIYPRSIRMKPIIKRGQLVEAHHVDGPMTISLKVEALEDGAPGQVIKIKNPQTRRELLGKVQNDGTISIYL